MIRDPETGERIYVVNTRSARSRELAYPADKPIFFLEDHREALQREDREPPLRCDAIR